MNSLRYQLRGISLFKIASVATNLGANITIDKRLFPSKARCRFIQYLPNKSDKFGINCVTWDFYRKK
ncbi:unnamed protein product, partial [Heterotrigona itama]